MLRSFFKPDLFRPDPLAECLFANFGDLGLVCLAFRAQGLVDVDVVAALQLVEEGAELSVEALEQSGELLRSHHSHVPRLLADDFGGKADVVGQLVLEASEVDALIFLRVGFDGGALDRVTVCLAKGVRLVLVAVLIGGEVRERLPRAGRLLCVVGRLVNHLDIFRLRIFRFVLSLVSLRFAGNVLVDLLGVLVVKVFLVFG